MSTEEARTERLQAFCAINGDMAAATAIGRVTYQDYPDTDWEPDSDEDGGIEDLFECLNPGQQERVLRILGA